jgi:hypothetical protein
MLLRNGRGRAERRVDAGVVQVAGLHGRVAVDNRLAIFGNPAGETLTNGNLQGREEAVVIAVDVRGRQHVAFAQPDDQRMMRDIAAQAGAQ